MAPGAIDIDDEALTFNSLFTFKGNGKWAVAVFTKTR